MSNNPSSRVVARIRPSALVFVVLILVIGALLLASNNIDPNAGKRAQFTATPIDMFANVKYISFKSPDGLVQFEHPDTWLPQPDSTAPIAYLVAMPGSASTFVRLFMARTDRLGLQNATATTPPDQLLKLIFASQPPGQAPVDIHPVQAGDLKGAGLHQSITQADPQSGASVTLDRELWILSLDPSNLVVVQAISTTADWSKMQPVFDHLTSTLKIDVAGSIKALAAEAATAEAATAAATAPASSAATQAPTAAVPAVNTAQATATK